MAHTLEQVKQIAASERRAARGRGPLRAGRGRDRDRNVGLAANPGLPHVPARPHRMALLSIGICWAVATINAQLSPGQNRQSSPRITPRLSRARVTGYRGSGTPYGLASHPSASMPAASAARTSALVGLTALLPWSVFSRPRARPDSTNGNAENVGVPTHAPESQPPNPMPEPRTRRGIMPLKPRRTRYHGLESLVIAGQERRARWRS